MRKKLQFEDVGLGDILKDYRPGLQSWVHYLVVDQRIGEMFVARIGIKNTPYFVLQPIDCDDRTDVHLNRWDLTHEYSTWRKMG